MRFTPGEVNDIRVTALAMRDTMNPHGSGCWRVHWPCRDMLLVDSLLETTNELEHLRTAHEKDRAEQQHLIGLLQNRLERIVYILDTHKAIVKKLQGKVNDAAAQLEGLHA